MTYQNDPNRRMDPVDRPSYPMTTEPNYTNWVIGGLAALVVAVAVIFMFGRNDNAKVARTDTSRPAVTAPSTTGSGTVPLPGSGNGVAGDTKQTIPPR